MIANPSIARKFLAGFLRAFVLVLAAGALGVTPSRAAAILYAAPAASGAGDCSSWEDACPLQTALNQSESGAEVWVKMGVYSPGPAGDRAATFNLKRGVALYGGFGGLETGRDQRDWQANVTILSGDIGGDDANTDGNFIAETWLDIRGENAYHVVTGVWTDAATVVDGFTITAGQANVLYDDNGGGVYNRDSSSPTLVNLSITGNFASQGGGMKNGSSSPVLTNVTLTGNYASSGGGMYNTTSNPVLTDVTFANNGADQGGGMYNQNSSPTLANVSFTGNSADQGGGMYSHDSGGPRLTNVTFSHNTASAYGGAMVNEYNSSPKLTNVLFAGNSADQAGAIYNHHISSPTLTNVTIAGNATHQGGGIMNGYYSWPVLVNTILWGNTVLNGPQIYNDGDSTTFLSYSDVQGCGGSAAWNAACGMDDGHNIDADPLYVDAANGNLRLAPDSPAVDTGTPAGAPAADLEGNPRDVLPDMGAYEYQWKWIRFFLPCVRRD